MYIYICIYIYVYIYIQYSMITLPCLRYLKLLTLRTSAGIPCHNFDAPNILSSTKFFGILFEDESITDYSDF